MINFSEQINYPMPKHRGYATTLCSCFDCRRGLYLLSNELKTWNIFVLSNIFNRSFHLTSIADILASPSSKRALWCRPVWPSAPRRRPGCRACRGRRASPRSRSAPSWCPPPTSSCPRSTGTPPWSLPAQHRAWLCVGLGKHRRCRTLSQTPEVSRLAGKGK